jgi:uncharacterized membrane protein
MLATIIVLTLIVVAFWKSIIRFVVGVVLVLLLVGGWQAAQMLGLVIPIQPTTQCPTGHTTC